jgi:pimeloyl-ACP methyl ester carboxylesterase
MTTARPLMVLVHGGLWEDMDAERFWVRPGVVAGLVGAGVEVLAPDRLPRPDSWAAEVEHLLGLLPAAPSTVVAGSNGCSVAARIAVEHPSRVARLVLAWPATAGDPRIDEWSRRQGVPDGMLAGETLRGVTDAELAGLPMPVAILPADDPFHQRRTTDSLVRVLPGSVELPTCPEPPRPDFTPAALVRTLLGWHPYLPG